MRSPIGSNLNPHLVTLGRMIHKHLYLLNQNDEVRKIFSPLQFASFKPPRYLASHLLRFAIYPLVKLKVVGSTKCQNKRYQVCYNVRETDCSQSYHLNSEYKINHKFHCNDKCWVYYLLTWKVCWKEQYVEETVDRFRLRWKNNNFLNDIVISFVDKTDPTFVVWTNQKETFFDKNNGLNVSEIV